MAVNPRTVLYEIVEREHPITLRGVFYRAVSMGLYPSTADNYYAQCGKEIQRMRSDKRVLSPIMHDIPYNWIVDSSRSREGSGGYSSLDRYIEDIPSRYGRNYWLDQPRHVEVITEKDAMATILRPVVAKWNVPFTVFRGNPSDTMCYNLGKLFAKVHSQGQQWEEETFEGKETVVLYLGDFDPSGLNISRVARRKIERFADRKVEWVRVAIGETQFRRMQDQFGIPVKRGDKLAKAYIERYGSDQCVEVDAIPSDEIRDLLERSIVKRIDMDLWKESAVVERREQRQLESLVSKMKGN